MDPAIDDEIAVVALSADENQELVFCFPGVGEDNPKENDGPRRESLIDQLSCLL
jgi:hypothetical protein